MTCTPGFNKKKRKKAKNLFDPILSIFVLLFPRNPMKSFAEDLHIPSKMKLHVEFLSNLSPVGERINLTLRKSALCSEHAF